MIIKIMMKKSKGRFDAKKYVIEQEEKKNMRARAYARQLTLKRRHLGKRWRDEPSIGQRISRARACDLLLLLLIIMKYCFCNDIMI